MDESSSPPPPPEKSTPPPASHGGIDVQRGDVQAGRDVVGGDVNIAGNSISGQTITVQEGFSPAQVQRLLFIVGGLIFASAACFFIFGAISAAVIVGVLNRPVLGGPANAQGAISMQQKLDRINSLPPGSEFTETFTEDEVNSYFNLVAGPKANISNGEARFLDTPGQIALGGNLDDNNGLPFSAVVSLTTDEVPVHVDNVWVKILPTPEGVNFGWVSVTPFATQFQAQISALLFGKVQFTRIVQGGATGQEVGPRAIGVRGVTK